MPRPVDVVLPPGRRCPPNLVFLAAIDHEAPRACQHWTSHRRDRLCARSRSPSRNRFRLHTGALGLFEWGETLLRTTDAALNIDITCLPMGRAAATDFFSKTSA